MIESSSFSGLLVLLWKFYQTFMRIMANFSKILRNYINNLKSKTPYMLMYTENTVLVLEFLLFCGCNGLLFKTLGIYIHSCIYNLPGFLLFNVFMVALVDCR